MNHASNAACCADMKKNRKTGLFCMSARQAIHRTGSIFISSPIKEDWEAGLKLLTRFCSLALCPLFTWISGWIFSGCKDKRKEERRCKAFALIIILCITFVVFFSVIMAEE